jgi:hypothetical protein
VSARVYVSGRRNAGDDSRRAPATMVVPSTATVARISAPKIA